MLREYKEQEKARAETALKAEKEARAKAALKAKKENTPPKISDEEYEKINRDHLHWAAYENYRPEIPLGSYRAEDGVVRKANGDPDFKYYDDWKQNYPGDFLILSNQVGITPEEQRWMSYANLSAEPVPLDGRGGEGRALKNEFSRMGKEGASESARLAKENVRRIQQKIDQKSITTKNSAEPIENTSEAMPSRSGNPKEKAPKTEGTAKASESYLSPEMEQKILGGERIPGKNGLRGGHSPNVVNNANPNYAVEVLRENPDGTKFVQFYHQFPDGTLAKLKKSTVFPNSWSDEKTISSIKKISDTPAVGSRTSDGVTTTLHSGTVDGVEIDVIKEGNNITAGYPVGGKPTPGFEPIN
ncbi:EndoU domain-containing protein [Paenibacillus sp. TY11]|uniref:EndoU domain-containing protein n=1 Tax=Paenibacillus sp. TY11 TaxID=3448633 RepID=UPI004039348A